MLRRNVLELCLIEFIRTLNIVENLEYVLNKHCRRFFTNIVKNILGLTSQPIEIFL